MFYRSEPKLLMSVAGVFARGRVGVDNVRSGADGRNVTAVRMFFGVGNESRVGILIRGLERVRDMVSMREAANWVPIILT